ncbi:hypothetical protein [Nocardiopsis baichengensis]|uniref:hypothetical protein n=1 Tax=Nocardiopsis baichengensis TaxID=280240 RepID=UPI00037BBFC9|nr:hypothetical protein [Nocardiopsis baichengensis]
MDTAGAGDRSAQDRVPGDGAPPQGPAEDDHPIEPEPPWPRSPTGVRIRCNRCAEPRHFADRHADRPDGNGPGPHCAVCGRRIEYRCTACGAPWRPLS